MSYFIRYRLWLFIFWLSPIIGNTQDPNTPVPYTLADRDRMMRMEMEVASLRKEVFAEIDKLNIKIGNLESKLESKIEGLRAEMNFKFDSQQRQMDDFKDLFFWSTGIIVSIILVLFGFILWDRHTMMKPFYQQNQTTILSLEKLKSAFKEVGQKNPDIKEALEKQGLV